MVNKKLGVLIFSLLFLVGVLGSVRAEATLTLTKPIGGEYWKGQQNITWTATSVDPGYKFYVYAWTDGGEPKYTINSGLAYDSRQIPWNTSSREDGEYTIRVMMWDSSTSTEVAEDFSELMTLDNTKPTIDSYTLITPNGGEKIKGGSTYSITWNSANITDTNFGGPINLTYTTNGTWLTIATGEANDGSYSWNVPSIDSTNVTVKITATDLAGNSVSDTSNAVFTIDGIAPSITTYTIDNTTISPNGDGYSDAAKITLGFSENSDYNIKILDSENNAIKSWSGTATNPDAKTWYGNYTNGTIVPDGVYTINISLKDTAGNMHLNTTKTITVESGTIYVGAGYTHTTIQAGINAASDGDTIIVSAGIYIEDLIINKTIELLGVDKATTKIKGVANVPIASWPLGVPNIDLQADNVKIHGFTIEGPDYEESYYASGIILDGENIEIYDNHFITTPAENADPNVDGELSHAVTTISKEVVGHETADVSGLHIHDNTFTGSGDIGYEGIYINPHTGTGTITIENNEFSGSTNIGITLESGNAIVRGNSLTTTLDYGTSPYGTYGIRFFDSNKDETYDNIMISNNSVQNFKRGVRIGNGGDGTSSITASITNNNLTNNEYGIWARQYGAHVTANYNNLSDNEYGVKNDGTASVNATFNWWGDVTPSDNVSGSVDYGHFAEDGSLTRFYAPVLGTIGNKDVNEGSALTITLSATDSDGDPLTYTDNVTFGTLTDNVFTWTPTGANQGNHSVFFTVSDGDLTDTEGVIINVSNVAPVVDAGSDQTVNEGGIVSFSSSATDAGGDTLTYSWDFGDGSTSDVQNPSHIYTDNRVYTVTLSASDGDASVSDTLTVTVNNVAPNITSTTKNITIAIVNELVQFNTTATDAGADDTLTYSWNFGDGNTSALDNSTNRYISAGTYTVTLTVTDDDGGSDSKTLEIKVYDLIWDLDSDWNLVSAPKDLIKNNTSGLLPHNEIWKYSQSSGWSRPDKIEAGVGYWVNSSTELGLNYSRDCSGPQCLPSGKINIDALQDGWNLIGLTSTEAKNVSSSFSSMIFDDTHLPVYYVINYNEGADAFEFLVADSILEPGKGYWVYKVE